MDKRINKVLLQYVAKPRIIDDIRTLLQREKSAVIELIGASGTGKSYIHTKLERTLSDHNTSFHTFSPAMFSFNQLDRLVQLVTDIDNDHYNQLVKDSRAYNLRNKYDFFFYLTERLSEEDRFQPKIILIDNCTLLDSYTLDFIQYLTQYAEDRKIFFVVFTNDDTFPFSNKLHIQFLNKDELQQIITAVFSDFEGDAGVQAEILQNITSGNVWIVERMLNRFYKDGKPERLNLSNFLDEKLTIPTMHKQLINNLKEQQRQIVLQCFFWEEKADIERISAIVKKPDNDLRTLMDIGLIEQTNGLYSVPKKVIFRNWFRSLSQEEQSKSLNLFIKHAQEFDVPDDKIEHYRFSMQEFNTENISPIIDYLNAICDHQTLREIYNVMVTGVDNPTRKIEILNKLGLTNKHLNNMEASAENFRQALRICTTHQLPAEEIVYHLAESLFAINSSTFGLEIIKKYYPSAEENYWKSRLLLLQSEILADLEKFDEALHFNDESYEIANKITSEKKRINLLADCKKVKAKIHYFSNQWEKAEMVFKEAEQLYSRVENTEGLAAIYNNIGVLSMFQGDWDKTEEFYLKSLELEKNRFNLNGISVCYNNLGGLLEDRGDFQRSLSYLYKALYIQKLLSDRYNITNIYNNIGVTYMDNAEYEKAAEAFEQSLQTALNFNLFRNIIAALNNLGALYFKSGKWTIAIDYYERAIERSKENNFLEGLCKSYNNLGELYEKRGEYNLAYDLYFKGLEILPGVQDEILKAELYGNLGSVLTHLHKFGKAYAYLVESYDFFKSMNAKDKLMIEACQKQAFYFIQTRNFESATYYLDQAEKMAQEINNRFEIGNTYFLRALLEHKDRERARKLLEQAIEIFVETKNNFELSQANYEYALILHETQDWEHALEILKTNKRIIREFDAINFLERNDVLIQKIMKEHAVELKESRNQESMLNKFYEITHELNLISDFDTLLNSAVENLVKLSEADGGVLCLYNSRLVPESWEYQIFKGFSTEEPDYDIMMDIIFDTYVNTNGKNIKQPHFAPQYNNIITFPLVIRNNKLGVICLFSKHGSHYFTEKLYNLLSALCNQIVVIIENIRHSNLAKSHAIIREELNASHSFTNIIGKSEKMQEIYRVIDKIKDTPTTILLEGPSGTGKELIARAIHYTSNRRNKKFVAQYCGALPETLLESELFGHMKGAFTGAAYDKKGLFEIADGGTFFLDEIADISLSTQAKLLRFLQEGEIKRVGSTKTSKVDVRVICATNISLSDKVKRDEFRLDLYYRLNVIKIKVPALKERKSDIPLLAIHFLDKYNKKMSKNVLGITDEAMKYLVSCDWPGNIRQLENEIERAVTLAENESFIKPSDLSEEVFKYTENAETVDLLDKVPLKDAVEDLERKLILKALETRSWNQTQAAKDLGLSRQGLIKKIKRYGIDK